MSTNRNIDKICIAVLVLTILLTAAFTNGERLGIRVAADEDAESYSGSAYFTENDRDGDWADNAYTTYITLDGSGGRIDGNGAYFLNGDLVISNGGWYVLSGTLEDGKIIVDADDSSKVWIRLNGVSVNCSDDAALRIDQADKVFLTLAEGSENSFISGSSYSEEALSDKTGGTIFSHDDLTINGSGSLTVIAGYKHGIDVNDTLAITGGSITVTAPQDGIHVNDSFRFSEASLTLDVGDDGVHSDDELYVESGTILISSCYEGMEAVTVDIAGGDIRICSEDDGINANGGGTTEFGGMGAGPLSNDMGGFAEGSGAKGTGRPSPADISAGGPPSLPDKMPDAFEAAQTESGGSSEEKETYIRISGGTLTIINETGRDADGLDSNGSIYIEGGDIRISLSGDGSNSAIDYGSESGGECIVTGGTLLAFGGSGMAEEFSSNSTQCSVLYNIGSTVQAGTVFRVLDANGEEVVSYAPAGSYSSVAFSAPGLTLGKTYTLVCGEISTELTPESTAVTVGDSAGMGDMRHQGMGGQPAEGMWERDAGAFSAQKDSAWQGGKGEEMADLVPEGPSGAEETNAASEGFTSLDGLDGNVRRLLLASALILAAAILFVRKYRKN